MLTYQVESYTQVKDDIKDLLKLHYEEVALDREHIPLDPDWDRYELLYNRGSLFIVTARDEDVLVGYSVFFISRHLHYNSTIVAANDVLYMKPEYRQGMSGIRLIKVSEEELKKIGVMKVVWHIKYHKDFRNILYRMGYKDEDAIVGKVLKD